ncbi:MAG: peptide chain release factor N(5)-glutamine methyltransferase [Actinomycetota bacterium]|nr:peptide chain release factor N(5)-glutamine methyltransferase [Actinomycetota bacterium]
MSEPRTVSELRRLGERVLADSTHIFEDHDTDNEAVELMAFVLDSDPDDVEDDERLSKRDADRYLALVTRRAAGAPFPVLVGRIEFYGLELKVWPGSFVPRPSSELVVDRAVRRLKRLDDPVVVDICTGAGPIALAIADEITDAQVHAMDIQEEGLAQGRKNARALEISNVTFKKGDMYDGLPRDLHGGVDVITAHVPYVPIDELDDLPAEVREHEPLFTLSDESDDGLYLMRRAILEAPEWLKPGGWLLLEVSDDLIPKLQALCTEAGLENKGAASDDDGLSVVVEARKSRG